MTTTLQTLSTGTRIATFVAVAGFVSAAWLAAGHESEKAVVNSAAAMAPRPIYVTLPSVEIVARRMAADPETALASNNAMHATNEL
ncbi:MAG TPA: hypothetical protein VMZ74_18255 [Ramlibacter sp.]|nr:hypothetical protein [Ramlibacter sp.]